MQDWFISLQNICFLEMLEDKNILFCFRNINPFSSGQRLHPDNLARQNICFLLFHKKIDARWFTGTADACVLPWMVVASVEYDGS